MRRAYLLLTVVSVLGACAQAYPHGTPRDGGGDATLANDSGMPGVDAFIPGNDAFVVPGDDAFVPGSDAFVPPNDAYVSPTDAFVTPTGRYLDRCTTASECTSGLCVPDRGGTHFCSRTCTSDLQCAHEHVCAAGTCVPDDTGAACSVGSPETCALGLCLGSAAGGHCTHGCTSAAECPAGYACSHVAGSSVQVCIDIEEPCSGAAACGGGYCTTFGCTAPCRSPADCPARLPGLPAYACNTSLGSADPICIPPSDIVGSQPAGAIVSCPAAGTNTCRSAACDPDAPFGPSCVQACTAQGGCGAGLGCTPVPAGTDIVLVCERAGTTDLTLTCAHSYECVSGLCDGSGAVGHCTRLCQDGLCPTGYTCQALAGFAISICRP